LSLDGAEHARHRAPFVGPFRAREVSERFAAETERVAGQLVSELAPAGRAELRTAFAGPLAASIVARALGLGADETPAVLASSRAIVASVTSITEGRGPTPEGRNAFGQLRARLLAVIDGDDRGSLLATAAGAGGLARDQIVSNAAVLLFGGIE